MPRPQKNRIVYHPPLYNGFKPEGPRSRDLETVYLSLDEYEAIRLADYLGMEHEAASVMMDISRSTFTRLVERARKKSARLLVEGKRLTIGGGQIHFQGNLIVCHNCGFTFQSELDNQMEACPECHSVNIVDMADKFGHGRCCHGHQNRNNNRRRR